MNRVPFLLTKTNNYLKHVSTKNDMFYMFYAVNLNSVIIITSSAILETIKDLSA